MSRLLAERLIEVSSRYELDAPSVIIIKKTTSVKIFPHFLIVEFEK